MCIEETQLEVFVSQFVKLACPIGRTESGGRLQFCVCKNRWTMNVRVGVIIVDIDVRIQFFAFVFMQKKPSYCCILIRRC